MVYRVLKRIDINVTECTAADVRCLHESAKIKQVKGITRSQDDVSHSHNRPREICTC